MVQLKQQTFDVEDDICDSFSLFSGRLSFGS